MIFKNRLRYSFISQVGLKSILKSPMRYIYINKGLIFFDVSLTVKAAPHEYVIRTGQPWA